MRVAAGQFTVAGATSASYTAGVSQTAYYCCLLTATNSAYNQATPGVQLIVSVPAPLPAISSFMPAGAVGNGVCQTQLTATGCGWIFVFTNTAGFVYSTVFRVRGCYTVSAPGVMKPGAYTLTVYDDGGTSTSATTTVQGEACP